MSMEREVRVDPVDVAIYMSDVVPQGQVVIGVDSALYHYGAYLHPTDYYWVKHKDNPELAHNLVMSWIDQRIEAMGKAAEARLDAMVEEMEFRAAHRATMAQYRDQIKFYHEMSFDDFATNFPTWGDAVEEGERIHREAEEEMLRQEHEDDAVHFRRQFIIRGENYISKLVSHNVLISKYIEIPQEESIIA